MRHCKQQLKSSIGATKKHGRKRLSTIINTEIYMHMHLEDGDFSEQPESACIEADDVEAIDEHICKANGDWSTKIKVV